jgi:tetratricopeptide (TPR) repeat protein
MRRRYFILAFLAFLVFLAPAARAADEKVQDAAYWRTEGDKSVQSREYDKAIECYKKSHAMEPLYARTVFRIAHVYNAVGKFEQSQPYLDKALELVKSGKDNSKLPISDIYAEKGYILLLMGKYSDALPLYDLAIEGDPKWSYPVFWKAYAYFKLNDYGKALELCNKVLQMEPNHKDAQKLKGMIEQRQSAPPSSPKK